MTTYRLEYTRRPWTENAMRREHFHTRARLVDEWRRAFCLLAREARVPPLAAISVQVVPHVKNRRSLPDTAACFGAYKASLDGVVDAGVLVDDGPDVVRSVTFHAPLVYGYDSLVLLVSPWAAEGAA